MNFLTSTFSFLVMRISIMRVAAVKLQGMIIEINLMKSGQRQQFSIKCECSVVRNNIQVNGKRKSKFSLITLDPNRKVLVIVPFGSTKSEEAITFHIAKLKTIHKKYIEEGKITVEFLDRMEKMQFKGVDVSALDEQVEVISSIFVSSAGKENLELLISKIIEIRKSESKPKAESKSAVAQVKPAQKKKLSTCENLQDEIKSEYLNRKELRKMASNPQIQSKTTLKVINKPVRYCLMDLPVTLLDSIFEYCQFSLSLRVINRKFSEYILKNILSIRLRDEVDEISFNKLCKWAINVECRMKNVKSIDLSDRYEQQVLLKNRAKTLKFGGWKEMTARNANQLKGMRIYSLEIPYQIKFEMQNFFGIRMVQLRLKSSSLVTTRNEFIRSEDIAHILRSIKDLKVLELPFVNSNLFKMIEFPKRLTELSITFLNDNTKDPDQWCDFSKFDNLQIFKLWHVQKMGNKKENHEIKLVLPQSLIELEVGSYISDEQLEALPISLQYLKLIGDGFYNNHIAKIYLPQLRHLDITLSKHIRQESLENMQNMHVVTSWDRQTVDFLANYNRRRNLTLSTICGFK